MNFSSLFFTRFKKCFKNYFSFEAMLQLSLFWHRALFSNTFVSKQTLRPLSYLTLRQWWKKKHSKSNLIYLAQGNIVNDKRYKVSPLESREGKIFVRPIVTLLLIPCVYDCEWVIVLIQTSRAIVFKKYTCSLINKNWKWKNIFALVSSKIFRIDVIINFANI